MALGAVPLLVFGDGTRNAALFAGEAADAHPAGSLWWLPDHINRHAVRDQLIATPSVISSWPKLAEPRDALAPPRTNTK